MNRFAIAAIAAAVSAPAAAQTDTVSAPDAMDWDVRTDEARQLILAGVQFDTGVALVVRCEAGTLDAVVTGLPPAMTTTRKVTVTFPGGLTEQESWATRPNAGYGAAPEPDRFARLLRGGPRLILSVAPETAEGVAREIDLVLPTQSAAIDRVLESCGADLSGPEDALPRLSGAGLSWRRPPALQFPAAALGRGMTHGEVALGCVVSAEGRPTRCWVERESPRGAGFGAAGLRAARDAEFDVAPGSPEGARLIRFSVRFTSR